MMHRMCIGGWCGVDSFDGGFGGIQQFHVGKVGRDKDGDRTSCWCFRGWNLREIWRLFDTSEVLFYKVAILGRLKVSWANFDGGKGIWLTMNDRKWMPTRGSISGLLRNRIKCLCSGEQLQGDQMECSNEYLTMKDYTMKDYTTSAFYSQNDESEQRIDTRNIEEAESSLREGLCLNYEEARALLGRLEYQKGNIEAALRVFDGIDLSSLAPKIRIAIMKKIEHHKYRSHWDAPPMSIHAVNLLVEAIYLKARALQDLGRFKEAAESCSIILESVESALPDGWPGNYLTDNKLEETVCKAVELLPELWKLGGFFHDAILSYRKALLGHWNLDDVTMARIQKEFSIFLLYGGYEANPPNLRSQIDGAFIPRNNIEEATLLLMILLRKFSLKKIEWDISVIDHLTYALTISGQLGSLAGKVEELLPGVVERKERFYTLSLCYLSVNDDLTALNLLKRILSKTEDPNCIKALLFASKVCGEKCGYAEDSVSYARRALANSHRCCYKTESTANCLLYISLSNLARSSTSDTERLSRQNEALEVLEKAEKVNPGKDCRILFNLSLENAEQRKLDVALRYAKQVLRLEGGSNVKGWILLARILSGQKRFTDCETILNAALEQVGKWSQGELLLCKAKIQFAQGQLKNAVETYTNVLAIVQLRSKSFSYGLTSLKGGKTDNSLEIQTWYDLANVYTFMSQWRDAEVCLSRIKAINTYSALGWHATGRLQEAKGHLKEAAGSYTKALDIDPRHVPSLISKAVLLRKLADQPLAVVRSLLTDAIWLDRSSHIAWFNLGLVYKAEGGNLAHDAVECFQAAALLEETAPVEPFR